MDTSIQSPTTGDFLSAHQESVVEYENFDTTNQMRAHLSITVAACLISFIGNPLVIFCIWRTPLLHDVTWLYQGVVCLSVLLHTISLPLSYMSHTDPMNWPLEGVYSCQAVHFFSDFGNVFMRLSMLAACGLRWLSYTSLSNISRDRPLVIVSSLVIATLVVSILSSIPAVNFVYLYQDDFGNAFCLFNDVRSSKYKVWFTYLLIMTLILPLLTMVLSNTLLMIRGDRLYAEEYDPRMEFHQINQPKPSKLKLAMETDNKPKVFDPTMLSSTVLENPLYDGNYANEANGTEQHKQQNGPTTIVKDSEYVIEMEDFRTLTINDQKKATWMQIWITAFFAICLAPISIIWGVYIGSDFNNNSAALFHCYRISGLIATTFPIHVPFACFLFSRHLRQNIIDLCKVPRN